MTTWLVFTIVFPNAFLLAMLSRSATYVKAGLATRDSKHRGSLLPIRGSLNHRRRRFRASVCDFEEALDLAARKGASPGQIGFLLTELRFAELFLFKVGGARRRIEEGLARMTPDASNAGFRVRALRKHVRESIACFDFSGAKASARLALHIAEEYRLL